MMFSRVASRGGVIRRLRVERGEGAGIGPLSVEQHRTSGLLWALRRCLLFRDATLRHLEKQYSVLPI